MDEKELIVRYLGILVAEASGTMEWSRLNTSWEKYVSSLNDQEQEKYLGLFSKFHKKYRLTNAR